MAGRRPTDSLQASRSGGSDDNASLLILLDRI